MRSQFAAVDHVMLSIWSGRSVRRGGALPHLDNCMTHTAHVVNKSRSIPFQIERFVKGTRDFSRLCLLIKRQYIQFFSLDSPTLYLSLHSFCLLLIRSFENANYFYLTHLLHRLRYDDNIRCSSVISNV